MAKNMEMSQTADQGHVMSELKKNAWQAYVKVSTKLDATNPSKTGWFEARRAIDTLVRTKNPVLTDVLEILTDAVKKNNAWAELHRLVFISTMSLGDQVRFIRPHAVTPLPGGALASFETHSHKQNLVSVRLANGVCINCSTTNLTPS